MRSFLAAVLFILTVLAVVAVALDLPYWLLPPEQKFARVWREDLNLLKEKGRFPEAWYDLGAIEFQSNDTIVHDWYQKTKSPFAAKKGGKYKLQILAIHLLEGNRYGVVLNYRWIDAATENVIGELGRTHKLGIIY